jgi:hypothetical protein
MPEVPRVPAACGRSAVRRRDLRLPRSPAAVSYLLLAVPFGLHPQSERLPVPIAAPSHKAQPARLRAGSRAAAHWDTGRRMAALFLLTTEIPRGAARPGRGAIQRGC